MKHLLLWALAVLVAVCVKAQNTTDDSAKPQFPGGDAALAQYIKEHVDVSQLCQEGTSRTFKVLLYLHEDGTIIVSSAAFTHSTRLQQNLSQVH